jgi:hypothetical protein
MENATYDTIFLSTNYDLRKKLLILLGMIHIEHLEMTVIAYSFTLLLCSVECMKIRGITSHLLFLNLRYNSGDYFFPNAFWRLESAKRLWPGLNLSLNTHHSTNFEFFSRILVINIIKNKDC